MPASRLTLGLVLLAAAGLSGCQREAPPTTRYPRTDPATWGSHAWGVLRWGMGPGDTDLFLQREAIGGSFASMGAIGRDARGQRYAIAGSTVTFAGTPTVLDLLFLDDRLFEVALWADGPRPGGPLARWREPQAHVAWSSLERDATEAEPSPAAAPERPRDAERRAVRQLAVILRSAAWERRIYGRSSLDAGWAREEFLAACRARASARTCQARLALVERSPARFEAWNGRWDEAERARPAKRTRRDRRSVATRKAAGRAASDERAAASAGAR